MSEMIEISVESVADRVVVSIVFIRSILCASTSTLPVPILSSLPPHFSPVAKRSVSPSPKLPHSYCPIPTRNAKPCQYIYSTPTPLHPFSKGRCYLLYPQALTERILLISTRPKHRNRSCLGTFYESFHLRFTFFECFRLLLFHKRICFSVRENALLLLWWWW